MREISELQIAPLITTEPDEKTDKNRLLTAERGTRNRSRKYRG